MLTLRAAVGAGEETRKYWWWSDRWTQLCSPHISKCDHEGGIDGTVQAVDPQLDPVK